MITYFYSVTVFLLLFKYFFIHIFIAVIEPHLKRMKNYEIFCVHLVSYENFKTKYIQGEPRQAFHKASWFLKFFPFSSKSTSSSSFFHNELVRKLLAFAKTFR